MFVYCLKTRRHSISPFLKGLQLARMKWEKRDGYLDATEVLESLVLKGVPFRMAHHEVGEWVRKAMENQCSLAEIQMNTINKKPFHLCTGREIESEDINNILALANEIRQSPAKFNKTLANKKLVMLFEKPSFRTRLSFSLAIQELGGVAVESIE